VDVRERVLCVFGVFVNTLLVFEQLWTNVSKEEHRRHDTILDVSKFPFGLLFKLLHKKNDFTSKAQLTHSHAVHAYTVKLTDVQRQSILKQRERVFPMDLTETQHLHQKCFAVSIVAALSSSRSVLQLPKV
jgi:hypothetical protein